MEINDSTNINLLESEDLGKIDINEIVPKPTVQRSAKGPVCIDECSPDGKYIQLANTSAIRDVDLTGWRLLRSVNNAPEISFAMPNNFKLNNRKSVKIYACDRDSERLPCDLVSSNISTWGVGHTIITRLLNDNDEEKAVHIQMIAK
ncbi:unnamed protein product [Adineta steineri]|uniref:LTD domain-containing protein n=1 Tax=Adineta steineri TaxID=433720 RepID=A0A813W7G3_9BILA|nr:unnamed protein product [Adineta steineri]CAF1308348.1 unnamed protein product [Adineta steineri]CAF1309418.1 unnamed protein product [Adineta steineri]